MADVTVYVLRDSSTKEVKAYSYAEFEEVPSGQEQVGVDVPEEDVAIFADKYTFNLSGDLIINAKKFYTLNVSENASSHNPATGHPQVVIGGTNYFTVTIEKKDIQGTYHTGAEDDDEVYLTPSGVGATPKNDVPEQINKISLVNGVATFRIYSGEELGETVITMQCATMATIGMGCAISVDTIPAP